MTWLQFIQYIESQIEGNSVTARGDYAVPIDIEYIDISHPEYDDLMVEVNTSQMPRRASINIWN